MDLSPGDPDELRGAVEGLRSSERGAVVEGGGTLLHVADASDATATIRTSSLDRVVAHEPADLTFTCQAGLTLSAARGVLAEHGQTIPVWHPAPERATLGGLAAFGWSGLGRGLFGPLRDRVLEVRAVTGEARMVRGGGKVVKNVTGFDLPRLFCGSMGTLGVLYELTLKVQPTPRELFGTGVRGGDAVAVVGVVREGLERVRMPIEGIVTGGADGWMGYAFAPGPRRDAEELLGGFGGEPMDGAQERFRGLAEDPLLVGGAEEGIVVRATAPPARLGELLGELVAARTIVDVGSGVIWATLGASADPARLRRAAEALGGSLVLLRAPEGMRREIGTWGSPAGGLELMRRLKAGYDPDGILGPGRFLV